MDLDLDWYYVSLDGERRGPVTILELKRAWDEKHLDFESLCWNEHLDNWQTIAQIPELKSIFLPVRKKKVQKPPSQPYPIQLEQRLNLDPSSANALPSAVAEIIQSVKQEILSAKQTVFVPHPTEAYVLGKIKEVQNQNCLVEINNGEILTVNSRDIVGTDPRTLRYDIDDLIDIDTLSDARMFFHLKERFKKRKIYTFISNILIVLNPWQPLDLYNLDIIRCYQNCSNFFLPHPFALASEAYSSLFEKDLDQSIIISGISGSGKTEAAKQCLMYLTEIAGSIEIDQKILATSPILECFGNAKCLSNHNASRFSRYLSIFFNDQGKISGATNSILLFDKSHLTNYSNKERNFHVFYTMCQGIPNNLRARLHLGHSSDYYILNIGKSLEIRGIDEAAEFDTLTQALSIIGFSSFDQDNIWQLLTSILNFGNLSFLDTNEGKCLINNEPFLLEASRLLSIDNNLLRSYLSTRIIKNPNSSVSLINLSSIDSCLNLASLIKFLYTLLFDWIVKQMNNTLNPLLFTSKNNTSISHVITITDFRYIEEFESNFFEALCNNYVSEKLQSFYLQRIFKQEFRVYQAENVAFDPISFYDNSAIIKLYEQIPSGIFYILDDETLNCGGTDSTFISRLNSSNVNSRCIKFSQYELNFSITHFQHYVSYNSSGFVSKNMINNELYNILRSTKWKFLQDLLAYGKSKSVSPSACQELQTELQDFLHKLNQSQPHFINCINPNAEKSANLFSGSFVDTQLKNFSLYETSQIRKKGFTGRLTHSDFILRYKCCSKRLLSDDIKIACVELAQDMNLNPLDLRIGVTSVLYHFSQYRVMESLRQKTLDKKVRIIQSFVRKHFAIRLLRKMKIVAPELKLAIQQQSIEQLKRSLEHAETLHINFPLFLVSQAKNLLSVLTLRQKTESQLVSLLSKDPDNCYDEFKDAIEAADSCSLSTEASNRAHLLFETANSKKQLFSELKQGLAEADENKLKSSLTKSMQLGYLPDNNPDLLTAQAMLQRITQEKPLIAKLYQAIEFGGWKNEGDSISTGFLKQTLIETQSFGIRTKEGRRLESLATILFNLREKMLSALGTENRSLWEEVDQVTKIGIEHFPDNAEIKAAVGKASIFTAVAFVNEQLNLAIQSLDCESLVINLEKAKFLNMNPDEYPMILIAEKYLARMQEASQLFEIAKSPLSQEKLEYALAFADSFNYNTNEVKESRDLLTNIIQLNANVSECLRLLEPAEMKRVLNLADSLNFTNESIEIIRNLLYRTQEEKFVQLQLKAAVAANDSARVAQVTIKLKTLFFATNGELFRFDRYPKLRTPSEFAEAKYFGLSFSKEQLAEGFLKFSSKPIHTSLCTLDSDATKTACRLFKNILGFMNEQTYSLAKDVCAICINSTELRDEVYCQLIKQLTQNPNIDGAQRGWQLMFLFLQVFPPGDELENYVEMWLRTHASPYEKFVTALHRTVYEGAFRFAPSQEEIIALISGKRLEKKTATQIESKQPLQPIEQKMSQEQLLQLQLERQQSELLRQRQLIQQQQELLKKQQSAPPIFIKESDKDRRENEINALQRSPNPKPSSHLPQIQNIPPPVSIPKQDSHFKPAHQLSPFQLQQIASVSSSPHYPTISSHPKTDLNSGNCTLSEPPLFESFTLSKPADLLPKSVSNIPKLYPSIRPAALHKLPGSEPSIGDTNEPSDSVAETSSHNLSFSPALKCSFPHCNLAREFGPYCVKHLASPQSLPQIESKDKTCVWKKFKNSKKETYYLNSHTMEITFQQPTDYFE